MQMRVQNPNTRFLYSKKAMITFSAFPGSAIVSVLSFANLDGKEFQLLFPTFLGWQLAILPAVLIYDFSPLPSLVWTYKFRILLQELGKNKTNQKSVCDTGDTSALAPFQLLLSTI